MKNFKAFFQKFQPKDKSTPYYRWIAIAALIISVVATSYYFQKGQLITYGDTESHLNISKRVIHSLTPGAAQLGGVWLPLTHVLLIPFVANDFLWQTGLAGAIVSGLFFIVASVYLYKLVWMLTKDVSASMMVFGVFALNPNILYLQSTAMTEIPLIAIFILSTYYFIKFLRNDSDLLSLLLASFFCFAATLTRYDGWFLAIFESALLVAHFVMVGIKKRSWSFWPKLEGTFLLFSSLAFFGVGLWLVWNLMILGDPLYFTNSDFSAKAQQNHWKSRGELPASHNLPLSVLYYTVTAMENSGAILFALAVFGMILYLVDRKQKVRLFVLALLLVPFVFNVVTLFIGQSIIFIPSLTPDTFEWNLFNVRYGVLMIPAVALFCGFLMHTFKPRWLKALVVIALVIQTSLFLSGRARAISFDDGVVGLSSSKTPDAQYWLQKNYDGGLVLMDDFSRTISITKTGIPMQNMIYLGNKPYWEESLESPEKYARWIVIQEHDPIWNKLYNNLDRQQHLYKYFQKAYTSPTILIFKRAENSTASK